MAKKKEPTIDWEIAVVNSRNQVVRANFEDNDDITALAQANEYAENLTNKSRFTNQETFKVVTAKEYAGGGDDDEEEEGAEAPADPPADPATPPAAPDYAADNTVAQLKVICKDRGISIPAGSKEADIVALLEGDDAAKAAE